MSKRLVLSGLTLLVGSPMLLGRLAPLGLALILAACTLLALPRLHGRRSPATPPRRPSPRRG